MTKKKFLIVSPRYDENVGGPIVLHRLCHLLNELGEKAELFPLFSNYMCIRDDKGLDVFHMSQVEYDMLKAGFKVNEEFNTPVLESVKGQGHWDDYIVIYPEITYGNPLGAKNVVRWLLHSPGFHTGKVKYGEGELYFLFAATFNFEPNIEKSKVSKLSKKYLTVTYMPFDIYNEQGVSANRSGIAYCLRKGAARAEGVDLSDGTIVDGLPHKQVAKIFKSASQLISYDLHSAYNLFAAICGCDVIVVPQEGLPIEEWMPEEKDRYGIAYGEENIEYARKTRHLRLAREIETESKSIESVKLALDEMKDFFG